MLVGPVDSLLSHSVSLAPLTFAAALLAACVLVAGALIYYALRKKGDVRAEFSHGSTMFKLEAKEPTRANNRTGRVS